MKWYWCDNCQKWVEFYETILPDRLKEIAHYLYCDECDLYIARYTEDD